MNLRSFFEELQENGRSGGLFVFSFVLFVIAAILWRVVIPIVILASAVYLFPWFLRQSRGRAGGVLSVGAFGFTLVALCAGAGLAAGGITEDQAVEAGLFCVAGTVFYGICGLWSGMPLGVKYLRIFAPLAILIFLWLRIMAPGS